MGSKRPTHHLTLTREEGEAVQRIVERLNAMSGRPFAHDPPACMRAHPAHVITPARVRALVRANLEGLTRRERIEEKLLAELTIAGRPFLELEKEGRHA